MSLTKNKIRETVEKFSAKPNDTGSTSVQVALVTERIQYLSKHILINAKDNASKLGLTKLVSQRKRLLSYLEANNREEYKKVIKALGLRK
jgi:small subunit ribosomal protein S15